jgi:hypothetical protein
MATIVGSEWAACGTSLGAAGDAGWCVAGSWACVGEASAMLAASKATTKRPFAAEKLLIMIRVPSTSLLIVVEK